MWTAERWAHVVHPDSHPEMAEHQGDVLRAIQQPTERLSGQVDGEVWFLLEDAGPGPGRWLHVVVSYEAHRAFVVTAFPPRRLP
ncbi:MAG: hypothetical protein ACP5H2_07110 [Solirubrobacteraceae bacterium]